MSAPPHPTAGVWGRRADWIPFPHPSSSYRLDTAPGEGSVSVCDTENNNNNYYYYYYYCYYCYYYYYYYYHGYDYYSM